MAVQAGEWTIEDLLDLPDDDDNNRYELVNGHLLVTPAPDKWHQGVGTRLLGQLITACPPEWQATYESLVAYERTGRVPDLLVVRTEALEDDTTAVYRRGDIGLLVEIVGPSSHRRDRIEKPPEYAVQGIEILWRVELEPEVAVHPFRLEDGSWTALPLVTERGMVPAPWGELELVIPLRSRSTRGTLEP